jgi:MoxR-like ATPase
MPNPKYVQSWQDVADNLSRFDTTKKTTLAYQRFSFYFNWYYLPEKDAFAPGKFLMCKSVTMESYDGREGSDHNVILKKYFDKLKPGSSRYNEVQAKLKTWAASLGQTLSGRIMEDRGGIYCPKPEFAPGEIHEVASEIASDSIRTEFTKLFEEFQATYYKDKGSAHNARYKESRVVAAQNFREISEARARHEDMTDRILLQLLPYTDTPANRAKGAWVQIAPAITGDLKGWFQNVGWTKPEDWQKIANLIFGFIDDCYNNTKTLSEACHSFAEAPLTKGFQSGMLTPFLNALDPERFLLINNKSRRVINHFTANSFPQGIEAYPDMNDIGFQLIEELGDILSAPATDDILTSDLFDMFCHWLVTEKEYFEKERKMQYWKIAPGANAELWDTCLRNGHIMIGWDELGDISGLSIKEFDKRYYEVLGRINDDSWTRYGAQQAWYFSRMPVGSLIVANKGTTEVVGIGRVKGPYYFVPGEKYGHRLPVDWFDTKPRKVKKEGWKRTLVKLDKDEYEEILLAEAPGPKPSPPVPGVKNAWIFQANPRYYDIRAAVESLEEINWGISYYRKEIEVGDEAYIWVSGPGAGIIAAGRILNNPTEAQQDEGEDQFSIEPGRFAGKRLRVRIKIENVLSYPILRSDLVEHSVLKDLAIIRFANAAIFKVKPVEHEALRALIGASGLERQPVYKLEQLMVDTGLTEATLTGWMNCLLRKKQIILQGPPGTGKTYVAEKLARLMVSASTGFWDVVQFHPTYAYEDFIQGLRPQPSGSGFEFELENGRFLEFCGRALRTEDPCVLIIDEINRAHLSRVFGELMYLLEYRHKEIALASGGVRFKIPENVYIIGTMNTADRSIALVDHALRRRFSFLRLNPDFEVLRKHLDKYGLPAESLVDVLAEINKAIADQNFSVGISYFMKDMENLRENLPDIWRGEIEPYLEEYFYDQAEKADSFRWDRLASEKLKDWVL